MSADVEVPTGPARRRVRRRRTLAAVGALTLLLAGIVIGGAPEQGRPLDPRSTAPNGLQGLVDLAEAMGAQVDISSEIPNDMSTTVLVARDGLGEERRQGLRSWARDGGGLVVTDRASPLHDLEPAGAPVTDMIGPSSRAPGCDVPALNEVATVRHASWAGFEEPDDARACFSGEGQAWLVARGHGRGSLVALGSPAPLINDALDDADNAVLAAALLFPESGARLQIVPPDAGPPAERSVDDLVPPRVWGALGLGLGAAVLALLALGRRLGRPIEERLPPTVPGAELVRSLGGLLQRGGRRDSAARRLRAGARAELARALGLGAAPAEVLADEARRRLDLSAETAHRALVDGPVEDDDALVAVGEATARLRDRLRRAF